MNSPHYMLEDSNFSFKYVRLCDVDIPTEKWLNYFANSGDTDQMPHFAASDLGLHCLSIISLGVSRLQRVKEFAPRKQPLWYYDEREKYFF